uniref:Uncharacterized protein n=1 Tax=Cyclopterus lumpus TaxID=8103 RepID=A0A8C2XLA2_CYCLU
IQKDHTTQKIKIYTVEGSDDVGIVLEVLKVATALDNIPRACCMLVGLAYAVNLAYPKKLRYTFEVFQKLLLKLDCSKLSLKVNSLKNKLLT